MSYVFGIDPRTISLDYTYPEVIALSNAASRLLVTIGQIRPIHSLIPAYTKPSQEPSSGPDTAGFRQMYKSHYKSKLD